MLAGVLRLIRRRVLLKGSLGSRIVDSEALDVPSWLVNELGGREHLAAS